MDIGHLGSYGFDEYNAYLSRKYVEIIRCVDTCVMPL